MGLRVLNFFFSNYCNFFSYNRCTQCLEKLFPCICLKVKCTAMSFRVNVRRAEVFSTSTRIGCESKFCLAIKTLAALRNRSSLCTHLSLVRDHKNGRQFFERLKSKGLFHLYSRRCPFGSRALDPIGLILSVSFHLQNRPIFLKKHLKSHRFSMKLWIQLIVGI